MKVRQQHRVTIEVVAGHNYVFGRGRESKLANVGFLDDKTMVVDDTHFVKFIGAKYDIIDKIVKEENEEMKMAGAVIGSLRERTTVDRLIYGTIGFNLVGNEKRKEFDCLILQYEHENEIHEVAFKRSSLTERLEKALIALELQEKETLSG